ncbi:hypothetical protein AK812_SmicGene37102 [Symbiodinium microadriaticum]|uniref:Uncharacterized protein n=1 Tax=Symbiodinium microadriaticum TaxID=2951 RepID=A0A1Q9CH38_SYMMI|nr:hypothetical protein AK812_SmicGene37102 [Symbiodinium microadriaticum]
MSLRSLRLTLDFRPGLGTQGQISGDQFQWNAEVPRRQPDRRLFDEARQLARQLVNPPFELSLADPTGGALYFDPRGA